MGLTMTHTIRLLAAWTALFILSGSLRAQILDKQKLLDQETFWDNRDWDWYQQNIPFFECPDREIQTTYYYRWELLTKHLTYGSPNSGFSFTEFIDRPFWSGAYGAISCPAGHQLYEARWLLDPRVARDYGKYWLRTPGAQPRNYSTWLADSLWAVHEVHSSEEYLLDLLPDLVRNYEAWEQRQFVPEVGLFWQTGHDDGMEFNINSRQTKDILRGAPSYRPSFNAYMWADAMAIARIADLADEPSIEKRFRDKAEALKNNVQTKLWDPQRKFFFPMYRDDEERDGHQVRKGTLTYQSGQFAGDSHGRELIGYVPWQFGMLDPDQGFEVAWKKLVDVDGFRAERGPCTVERNDPMFLLQKWCCWWSGQSWPYATTQTLKGLANMLQDPGAKSPLTKADYFQVLRTYALSHRKDGKPYLAEALHPDTGSFEGHDGYNHSEHYFHSGFCDLIITGLVGVVPSADQELTIKPLAPADWDYFALDQLQYQGHTLTVFWDRTGQRYGHGAGLQVWANGKMVARSQKLEALEVKLPDPPETTEPSSTVRTNFAVNNDGWYFPRFTSSFANPQTPINKLHDGNSWYHEHPPNRWTCQGSPNPVDWVVVDFGTARTFDEIQLYFLDDDGKTPIAAPRSVTLESWQQGQWQPIAAKPALPAPTGHRANRYRLEPISTERVRVSFEHSGETRSGLTELEIWGNATLPLEPVLMPAGNLAFNNGKQEFPKASASHTSRYDKVASANDGIVHFGATPNNRWTSYESPDKTDWLEIDFGQPTRFSRIELALYDDRGGVQPPQSFEIEVWDGSSWKVIPDQTRSPEKPVGGQFNESRFASLESTKVRFVFTHQGAARTGLTEVLVWPE